MASILDRCRGISDAKRGIRVIERSHRLMMSDPEYNSYLNEVQALSKKDQKKWKRKNVKSDGSVSIIRFNGKGLYTQWLNLHVDVISQTMLEDLTRERENHPQNVTLVETDSWRNTEALYEDFGQRLIESHTGNHTCRNHPVRVPTNAGEPVRA